MRRTLLLAGASALAILVAAGAADAETFKFTTPGFFAFTAPTTGEYLIALSGASGGSNVGTHLAGGLGASISGVVKLFAGDSLGLNVGAEGQYTGGESLKTGGAGGGGSSFVVGPDRPGDEVGEAVAGGGGAGFTGVGGPGLTGPSGGAGGGTNGGAGGTQAYGGGGGSFALGSNGGGGAGVPSGDISGNGGNGSGRDSGAAGIFPHGGAGSATGGTAATTAAGAAGQAFPGAVEAAATAAEAGVPISAGHLPVSTSSLGRIPATVRSASWKSTGRQFPSPRPGQ